MDKNEINDTDVLSPNYQSKLGTLAHWEEAYSQEIEQFHNNNGELGDIWFGKSLQKKINFYIEQNFPDKNITLLDVGCGNGVFLYKLAKKGYLNLYGIDYSSQSIKFANEILNKKGEKHNKKYKINLYQEDINNKGNDINIKFDIIHDKGSMDAYLMNKSNTLENYYKYILSYSKNNTYFIITSCNNTREELRNIFPEEKGFKYVNEIKNKTFSFGGQEGQTAATQIYKIEL